MVVIRNSILVTVAGAGRAICNNGFECFQGVCPYFTCNALAEWEGPNGSCTAQGSFV